MTYSIYENLDPDYSDVVCIISHRNYDGYSFVDNGYLERSMDRVSRGYGWCNDSRIGSKLGEFDTTEDFHNNFPELLI